MKSLLTLKPSERRLTLATLVLVGSWIVISWVVRPMWNRTGELAQHVEGQREKLTALSRLLAQRPQVEQEYQQLLPYLEVGSDEQAQSAFLQELEALSRRTKLKLSLKPRPTRTVGATQRFEVELDVEGTQANLLGFLDALFAVPKLIAVERLRLASMPAKRDRLRANLIIQQVTLR